jgi:hypothetical protein
VKFLLLNIDYDAFLAQLYGRERGLARASYDTQLAARNATFFGVGDAYAEALRERGHEAHDIHLNNAVLQEAWVREHGPAALQRGARPVRFRLRRGIVPWIDRTPDHDWLTSVFAAQVAHHRPDVVLNHVLSWAPPAVMREIVGKDTLLIGQHAAPPYTPADYRPYDLVVSSWPPTIARMRDGGVRAEHLGLGFDPRVLDVIGTVERDLPLTFVGSLSQMHGVRSELIESLCASVPGMRVYAPSMYGMPKGSATRRCYAGPAYGIDMFRVLARSQATVNHHGFPEPHANNMRLFEATGMGALLLTDDKPDVDQYFAVGREALTYRDAADCAGQLRELDPSARAQIAAAGQARTLTDHTWSKRIDELLTLVDSLDTGRRTP